MNTRLSLLRRLLAPALSLCLAGPAAADYSQIIAFGDSLSDTGNLYALTSFLPTGGIPGSPYYAGRFTNGLLAVESMGFGLNVNVTSYAYGGALTGLNNSVSAKLDGTGVAGQVSKFTADLNGGAADGAALYFVWAGPDDFYSGSNMMSNKAASTAVANMLANVKSLFDGGARNFFVPLMPDLSTTPSALKDTQAFRDAAALRTQEYNSQLSSGLHDLMAGTPGMKVTIFDTPAFIAKTVPELVAGNYNVTDACFDSTTQAVCSLQDQYLFWDTIHPSAAGHWILGQAFAKAASAVPEPNSAYLVMVGLGVLAWRGRRSMVVSKGPRPGLMTPCMA